MFVDRDGKSTSRGGESSARYMVEQFVKDKLKAPATAKFPSWGDRADVTDIGNFRYRVSGYVDSQNGFGAMIRTHYVAVVRDKGGRNWSLESLDMQ